MTELATQLPVARSVVDRIAYHHLAAATLAGTYAVMILGAYTSAIGAGLSCPD